MRSEYFGRIIVLILALGVGFSALAYRYFNGLGVIELHGAMPDKGGWLISNIDAVVNEPLRLRLISDDVVHSFALGQSDFVPVDLLPGKPVDITLTFDQPGTFTYYCTRWCGADHWRMRGKITVTGDKPFDISLPEPPLYLQLGIDLDAVHESHELIWDQKPSAVRGMDLNQDLSPEFFIKENYRSLSPEQVWKTLDASPITKGLNESQIWDVVAWINLQNTTSSQLVEGKALYQRDCAACHGVNGSGDGVFGGVNNSDISSPHETTNQGHAVEPPTNFTDQNHMLFTSPALLQGKIIRGGMGTGMPSWGLIYTEDQTWNLVDYLWTFIFTYPSEE